ncbi:galactokinase [Catalinimonas alkaloidigena]|uniref:Galactokinase n=1 Tax=Catalinimonas alkaloidigena TaxID=1075417 RepID=A0A1G9J534_9BACT|nr:galactokinase [Catalinimonas alkaloidigena]SDL32366.1 galactokinase [Catalinimonas alkaloidigena]
MEVQDIADKFKQLFDATPLLVRSPGRINLIGEHTDYNDGFVLPAAIDKEIIFAIAPNQTRKARFYAFNFDDSFEVDLLELTRNEKNWANYLMGVVWELQQLGHRIEGFDLVLGGNVPIGAGLSSSAAVECGLAYALNALFELQVPTLDLIQLVQRAENNFVGMKCGIMDPFAVMLGKRDRVIKLDCRSLEYEYYPFEIDAYRVVLCDSNIEHALVDSEYNVRRHQCEEGVRIIQRRAPNVQSLRDVTMGLLRQCRDEMDPLIYRRCSYVVQENTRVELACRDLEVRSLNAFGKQMYRTHHGLSHDYEVSTPELDFLVARSQEDPHVLGARLMGGGFGGCTINLVEVDHVTDFAERMKNAYYTETKRDLSLYVTRIVDGVSPV